jgi:hypothetical protein
MTSILSRIKNLAPNAFPVAPFDSIILTLSKAQKLVFFSRSVLVVTQFYIKLVKCYAKQTPLLKKPPRILF